MSLEMLKFCFKTLTQDYLHKDKVSVSTLVFKRGETTALSLTTKYTKIGKMWGPRAS